MESLINVKLSSALARAAAIESDLVVSGTHTLDSLIVELTSEFPALKPVFRSADGSLNVFLAVSINGQVWDVNEDHSRSIGPNSSVRLFTGIAGG